MRCVTTHSELKSQVCEGLAAPMEALSEMAYQMFLPQFSPNEGDDLRNANLKALVKILVKPGYYSSYIDFSKKCKKKVKNLYLERVE